MRKFLNNKAQAMPFMVLLISVLLLTVIGTYRIGDVSTKKLRLVNAVDAATISGASELSRGLNRIRQANVGGRGNPIGGPGDGLFIKWLRLQVFCLAVVHPDVVPCERTAVHGVPSTPKGSQLAVGAGELRGLRGCEAVRHKDVVRGVGICGSSSAGHEKQDERQE